MKDKYELAVRDKVINQLEKERAVGELKSMKQNESDPLGDKKSGSAGVNIQRK